MSLLPLFPRMEPNVQLLGTDIFSPINPITPNVTLAPLSHERTAMMPQSNSPAAASSPNDDGSSGVGS
jgi:hypothetical protein